MKLKFPFEGKNTLGAVLATLSVAVGTVLFFGVAYFYVYLPNSTNHGDHIPVPDLTGKRISQLDSTLTPLGLRYEIGDSAYSADFPPLTVLQQFPKAGHQVKGKPEDLFVDQPRITTDVTIAEFIWRRKLRFSSQCPGCFEKQ